ncbi:hypothetical protein CEXT_226611 [Caerostris extrusa]|uniref:Uncharacterized protein n=1 Tax=Caerostris extrusa TaxID=172846 RepID=A0AAV4VKU9_CAEEX|nr:hypothetical protein CEXT_226611 [Caerostris extrusa]
MLPSALEPRSQASKAKQSSHCTSHGCFTFSRPSELTSPSLKVLPKFNGNITPQVRGYDGEEPNLCLLPAK